MVAWSQVSPKCVLAIAENAQYWPEVLATKASLDRGDIGELLTVRVKAWESATGEWAVDYAEGVSLARTFSHVLFSPPSSTAFLRSHVDACHPAHCGRFAAAVLLLAAGVAMR